jgi:hypothetical protein
MQQSKLKGHEDHQKKSTLEKAMAARPAPETS